MFPGTSDPLFPTNWTMVTAGIPGDDMRGIPSSGRFSIAPGETRTIDFAYITTRDTINFPNFTYNHNEVAKVLYWFEHDQLSSCPPPVPVGIPDQTNNVQSLVIRPNPARDIITLQNISIENNYIYTISDITGKIFIKSSLDKRDVDISKLSPGVYLIKIENKLEIRQAKFMIIK